MKSTALLASAVSLASLSGPLAAGDFAAGDFSKSLPVTPPPPPSAWTVGLGLAPLVNVDASFSGLGAWASPNPVPTGAPGTDRTYDDGFNRVDSSGNNNNLTWNWGYDNPGQYDPAGDGSIAMSIHNSYANASADADDEFNFGLELFAQRDMGELPSLSLGGQPARWGWKFGLNYVNLDAEDSGALSSGVLRVTDTYSLGGVLPPGAPYAGSFDGPGALLSDTATRATSAVAGLATVTGRRELDANLFALSAGPYLSISPAPRLAVQAEAGLTLALIDGEYEVSSTTTIPGLAPHSTSGSSDQTDLLPGFYLGTSVLYDLNGPWGIYGSVRYQFLDDFEIGAAGSDAQFSFDKSFFLAIGATRRF